MPSRLTERNVHSLQPLWVIIRDMAQLYDIYKFVKASEKVARKEEKTDPYTRAVSGMYIVKEPSMFRVRDVYKKPHWWWFRGRSDRKVTHVMGLTLHRGYLNGETQRIDGLDIRVFRITDKGIDLVQRSFFGILPKGLLLAWAEKNSNFHQFVFGFATGTVLGITGIVIAVMK